MEAKEDNSTNRASGQRQKKTARTGKERAAKTLNQHLERQVQPTNSDSLTMCAKARVHMERKNGEEREQKPKAGEHKERSWVSKRINPLICRIDDLDLSLAEYRLLMHLVRRSMKKGEAWSFLVKPTFPRSDHMGF
jgi:hypothetical protein